MELARIEQNDRNRVSLRFRATLFFIFFFLSMFAIFMLTSIAQGNAITHYLCEQRAVPALEQAAAVIDGDAFEALAASGDDTDPYYEKTRVKLLMIKNDLHVPYLYTMAPVEGTVYQYVIDGSADPSNEDSFSPLGEEEDIGEWEANALAVMRDGVRKFGTIDLSEEWGATISAYEPIRNSKGKLVGFIGCDLAAGSTIVWIRRQILWQLSIIFLFSVGAFFLYLWVHRRIQKIFSLEDMGSDASNRRLLRLRFGVFFAFYIVSLAAVFYIISVFHTTAVVRYICSELSAPTVAKAKTFIDPAQYKRISETKDRTDPYFISTQKELYELKETSGVLYLYMMAPTDSPDRWMYVIDGSDPLEVAENEEDFGWPGVVIEEGYEDAFWKTLQTRQIQYGEVQQTDWGRTVTAYSPIFDNAGKIIGAIGCDIDAQGIISWINLQNTGLFIIAGVFLVLGLGIYLLVWRRVGVVFSGKDEAASGDFAAAQMAAA